MVQCPVGWMHNPALYHQGSSALSSTLKGPLDHCQAAPQQAGLQAWLLVSCCPAKPAQDRIMVHGCGGAS